jgi:adenosylcobinamide-GDP ribazoletransferase
VCALVTSLLLRWSALVTIAEPAGVAMALMAAHTSARAVLPPFMLAVAPARHDGLSAHAGRPPPASAIAAAVLGVVALALTLGPAGATIALVALAGAAILMAWLTTRQIGGQTGDVLGALEQAAEVLVLLTAAALLHAQAA